MEGHAPVQIPELVRPLGHNSQRILQESDDDEESANSRQIRLEWLCPDLDVIFDLASDCLELFEGVVWVGGPVARRGARV